MGNLVEVRGVEPLSKSRLAMGLVTCFSANEKFQAPCSFAKQKALVQSVR